MQHGASASTGGIDAATGVGAEGVSIGGSMSMGSSSPPVEATTSGTGTGTGAGTAGDARAAVNKARQMAALRRDIYKFSIKIRINKFA